MASQNAATTPPTRKELLKLTKKELIKLCKKEKVSFNGSKADMASEILAKYPDVNKRTDNSQIYLSTIASTIQKNQQNQNNPVTIPSNNNIDNKDNDVADLPKNPYDATYLKQHKDIQLPPLFGKSVSNSKPNDKYRSDYTSLNRVKLFTIKNILTSSECNKLISLTSSIGYVPITFEYPDDYRKCQRVICKSFKLSSIIWSKVIPYLTRNDVEDIRPYGFGNKGIWRPTHINEAIRFTRYRDGDFFKAHRDGGFTKSCLNRSVYTIMIYLNDSVNDKDFTGGDTVFYSLKNDKNRNKQTNDDDNDDVDDNSDLYLTDDDKKTAISVRINPVKGMCVIFNHDVWHEGETVNVAVKYKNIKYKYIIRSDIMFECFGPETFNRSNLLSDPLYIKTQYYYKRTIDLQNEGKVRESTISYLRALSIQASLPSVIIDKNQDYFGDEYYWFPPIIYDEIFSYLDVYRLINILYVSRAWYYYATSPMLWKIKYQKYFNIKEIKQNIDNKQLINTNNNDYNSLFRPWKHLFSYRVMLKNKFPILVLNFWVNGIEIGTTSKKQKKAMVLDRYQSYGSSTKAVPTYLNNDQQLMLNHRTDALYIPFAVGRYQESNSWSWKPYRKETLYGQIIFRGDHGASSYGFSTPKWIINEKGILDGLNFYKLLKEIIYFPNVCISLPSIMSDNKLFILYLKYLITKFNNDKIFCLMIKNMEESIAKHYKYKNCIVILNEHRSFSISIIKNNVRILPKQNAKLSVKYLARDHPDPNPRNCFPNKYYHYKDNYDDYYVSNISNFDFIYSLNNKTNILQQTASSDEQKAEADPDLPRYSWRSQHNFKWINKSTTAPKPIINNDDNNDNSYYDINNVSYDILKKEIIKYLIKNNKKQLADSLEKLNGIGFIDLLINDIFVGPNKGKDIPQNDDFAHLKNLYYVRTSALKSKDFAYYQRNNAPLNNKLCYNPLHLMKALHDVVKECNDSKVFDDKKDDNNDNIPVILVGPLSEYYGQFILEYCNMYNDDDDDDGIRIQFINEYVRNDGVRNISSRSSGLQYLLQTIVSPKEIANFKSIQKIKNEIIEKQKQKQKKNNINLVGDKNDDVVIVGWQWQDNNDKWKSYDDNITKIIEKLKIGEKHKFKVYKITKNTKHSATQVNIFTKTKRKCRQQIMSKKTKKIKKDK